MAIEDAAALGILFSQGYFDGDVAATLKLYQEVRLPRATKVQAASAKAAYNINERIGKEIAESHCRLRSCGYAYHEFQFLYHHAENSLAQMLTSGPQGFSSNTDIPNYKVEDEKIKLTIEEMNG